MEKVLVVDANARLRGKRLTTLDVIGVGPRVVAALLRRYGFQASLYPYEKVIANPSIMKEYDVLAASFMISDAVAVKNLIRAWRKTKESEGIVVLGGPGVLSTEMLKRLDFDIAIIGEAEVVLHEMFYSRGFRSFRDVVEGAEETNAVRGVCIRRGGKIIDGGLGPWAPRELLFKVMPDIEGVTRYPFYWACRIYVEVVRGCSNFRRALITSSGIRCTNCGLCRSGDLSQRLWCPIGIPPGCGYCSVPLVHGPPRSRDLYSIIEETQRLIDIGATRIVLSAPDFLDYGREIGIEGPLTDPCYPPPNLDMIEKLLRELTRIDAIVDGRATLMIENIKACLVDERVAEVLGRYLKGTAIYIGLESCSEELLKAMGRPSTCRDTLRAIELLTRHGLKPYVYLIHGLPLEGVDDIAKTIEVLPHLEKIGVERIILYRFTPLPRTALSKGSTNTNTDYVQIVERLKNDVKRFNEKAKASLVGRVMDVIIASTYPKDKRYLVSYPLRHGPVVLLRLPKKFVGYIARVRISKVISDRIVLGILVQLIRRVVKVC